MSAVPPSDDLRQVIEKVGNVLAGSIGAARLCVVRCNNLEQVQRALQLLPRGYPKIKWLPIPVIPVGTAKAVAQAAAHAGNPRAVPILYHFPGETTDKRIAAEAAREFEAAAAKAGLSSLPVLVLIYAASIKVFADEARGTWRKKGGYFAWPAAPPPVEEQKDEPAAPPPELAAEGDGPPSDEQLRKVVGTLDGEPAAKYLVHVSRSYLARGIGEAPRTFLLRAVQIYSRSANLSGMAEAYHLLGLASQVQGDLKTAIEWFSQAADNFAVLDDKAALAEAQSQKGFAHFQNGELEKAAKAFDAAVRLHKELGLTRNVSAGYRRLAMVLEKAQNFPTAEDLLRQSLEMEKELGSKEGIARVLHSLGRIKEAAGSYPEALALYNESLEKKKEIGDEGGMAATCHQMGNLQAGVGKPHEAIPHYEEAIRLERKVGDRPGLARTLAQLGLAQKQIGDIEKALGSLLRAHAILHAFRSPLADEVLAQVEALQDLVPAETFNAILREANEEGEKQ